MACAYFLTLDSLNHTSRDLIFSVESRGSGAVSSFSCLLLLRQVSVFVCARMRMPVLLCLIHCQILWPFEFYWIVLHGGVWFSSAASLLVWACSISSLVLPSCLSDGLFVCLGLRSIDLLSGTLMSSLVLDYPLMILSSFNKPGAIKTNILYKIHFARLMTEASMDMPSASLPHFSRSGLLQLGFEWRWMASGQRWAKQRAVFHYLSLIWPRFLSPTESFMFTLVYWIRRGLFDFFLQLNNTTSGLETKLPWFDGQPALGKRAEAGWPDDAGWQCHRWWFVKVFSLECEMHWDPNDPKVFKQVIFVHATKYDKIYDSREPSSIVCLTETILQLLLTIFPVHL